SSAAGTTRATRPARSASCASIIRPVKMRSMALLLPTARVSRCVPPIPGMTPSLISGWPNFALSAAMTTSHCIASSQPPPRAKPRARRDHGLARVRHQIPAPDEIRHEGFQVGLVDHFLDIGAGGEGFVRAGDENAADIGIGFEAIDRRPEFVDQHR